MSSTIVLDARALSQIAHPRKHTDISEWFLDVAASGRRIVLPEIVDYEVRRGLLRIPAPRQIEELDALKESLYYFPLTTELMLNAAQIWADARRSGRPFTADDRLDGDAILIAQVHALGDRRSVTLITNNRQHFAHYVEAMWWPEFAP